MRRSDVLQQSPDAGDCDRRRYRHRASDPRRRQGITLERWGGPIVYEPRSILEWDPAVFWTINALAAACSTVGRCTLTERIEAYDKPVHYASTAYDHCPFGRNDPGRGYALPCRTW
jgi:hypothetical protein